MGTPTWLVTHTHLDHIAALPVYVARRRMMKMEPPTIYVPAEAVEDVRRLLLIMQRLDRGRHGLRAATASTPGEEIELSREHVVTAVRHDAHDPVGRLRGLGAALQAQGGVPRPARRQDPRPAASPAWQVTREVRTPLVAYTGDTSPAGLDAYPAVFEAKILITEMSFIRPNHRREKIHKFGHMHLDDFLERADRFENELIICGHFSTRYHPQEVRRVVEARLPPRLRERVRLWL